LNIFRVLASGRQSVREEFVSAFLAYLLSPKMDHGLGYAFLSRLLVGVAERNDIPALKEVAANLRSRLWEDIFSEDNSLPVVELEFRVPGNRSIDVVVKCDNWFILIENKIVQSSKTDGQLSAQYKGFMEVIEEKGLAKDSRVLVLYVVPAATAGESWTVSPGFYGELDSLKLRPFDAKALVSWQPTNDVESSCSVISIIREILRDESNGLLSPIGTEVRHALLSLIDFAMDEFHGFHYQHATSSPKATVPKMKVREVLKLEGDYYVGIQHGVCGVGLRAWRNNSFLDYEVVVTDDNGRGSHYMPLRTFQILTKWSLDPDVNSLDGIEWSGAPLATATVFRAGKHGAHAALFVGIRGGLKALKALPPDQAKSRPYQLNSKHKSKDWIPVAEFSAALEEMGVQFD
jgi:hypothetical protein